MDRPCRTCTGLVVSAILLCLGGPPVWAQPPTPSPPPGETTPGPSIEEPGPLSPYPTPLAPYLGPPVIPAPVPIGPLVAGRRARRARGPIVLTPTLTITEEWTDNVFLEARNRRSDFLTAFSPGLELTLEDPIYRLNAAYGFSALLYANESELNSVRGREFLTLAGSYRATPRLTLALADSYVKAENSNVGSVEGFSIGRTTTTTNIFAPSASYIVDMRTTVNLSGSWAHQTADTEPSRTSDAYRAEAMVDRRLTPRLSVTGGYAFGHIDTEREAPVTTHTPLIGGTYRLTPTLVATAAAGPQVVQQSGDSSLAWSARGSVAQQFRWGAGSVSYSHDQSPSGGFGVVSETDTVTGQLQVTTLRRGLVLAFSPRYSRSAGGARGGDLQGARGGDLQAFNLSVQGSYQLTAWLTLVGAYTFFDQRTSTGAGAAGRGTIEQNRLFLGLQVRYPIRFE